MDYCHSEILAVDDDVNVENQGRPEKNVVVIYYSTSGVQVTYQDDEIVPGL